MTEMETTRWLQVTYRFEHALGSAVVRLWADLPRDTQELLSDEAALGDDDLRESLAAFFPRQASKDHP
jgi:hypothetical protein